MTRAKRLNPITLFDSDSSNPYSLELKHLLIDAGADVKLVGSADSLGVDSGLRPRFSAVRPRHILLELVTFWKVVFDPHPLVIIWARTYQKVFISLFGFHRGRQVYLIVHNPSPARWPRGTFRGRLETFLVNRAHCLTHSQSLSSNLESLAGKPAESVVPHPPYHLWVKQWIAASTPREPNDGPVRAVLIGRLSKDKFSDLSALFCAIAERKDLTVRAVVRPRINDSSSLGIPYNLENRSSDSWITDSELGSALGWADILIAPYTDVTESGTVHLALSAGVKVVAFRGGALADNLRADAMADVGDYDALIAAAVSVVRLSKPTNLRSPADQYADCKVAWSLALGIE